MPAFWKIRRSNLLRVLGVLFPIAATPLALGQCPPRYEVDVIQPPSCGIFDPAITVWEISSSGHLCGTRSGCSDSSGGPFAWFGEPPIVDIPEPPNYPLADAYGINSFQQVVGSMRNGTGNTDPRGFLYEHGKGMTTLEPLPGDTKAEAGAIADNGTVCGYSQLINQRAVVWQGYSPSALDLPLGPNSVANDISNNGLVTGWMGTATTTTSRAFVHNLVTGETTDVGTPLPNTTNAKGNGVNGAGNICGQSWVPCSPSCGVWKGFFWSNGTGYHLGTLPNFPRCSPGGLNDSNVVAGACSTQTGVTRAFVWQNGIMYALNDLVPAELNLNVQIATGINNAGQIGASGKFNGGAYVALRLNPIPPQKGDCTCDWIVNSADIMAVIRNWGECPPEFTAPCTADLNDDQRVNVPDVLTVLNHWGQGQGMP